MIFCFGSAFPDLLLDVHDMSGVNDKVATRFTMRGLLTQLSAVDPRPRKPT